MKNFSLQKRLIIVLAVSLFLLAIGLVVIDTSFSRHYGRRAFDVYLEGRARSIAALVYYPDDGSPGLLFGEAKIPPAEHHGAGDLFWVTSDKGNFERHTPGMDPRIFARIPAGASFWNFRWSGEAYRAIVLRDVAILDTEEGIPLPLPTLTVIYAAPTGGLDHAMEELAASIGGVSLLILIPTLWLAIWSVRKALTPLHDLATAAGKISVDRWRFEPSDEARATEELQPLIGAVTTVLAGLEAAFKRQQTFMGDAAHELKTSLAILKSTLQMLQAKPPEQGDYECGLLVMNRDCDRLERLLNRMLQSARAEQRVANGFDGQLEPVDIAASCEEALAQLAQLAESHQIRLEFSTAGDALLRAESADLELIWTNLLENAIQYSPHGSVVSMALTTHDGWASVAVVDRGCGIERTHLPYIFERFYRADSSRARTTGGFGLGLAISKSLVEFYGGHIRAESELGRGTRVTVRLPVEGC